MSNLAAFENPSGSAASAEAACTTASPSGVWCGLSTQACQAPGASPTVGSACSGEDVRTTGSGSCGLTWPAVGLSPELAPPPSTPPWSACACATAGCPANDRGRRQGSQPRRSAHWRRPRVAARVRVKTCQPQVRTFSDPGLQLSSHRNSRRLPRTAPGLAVPAFRSTARASGEQSLPSPQLPPAGCPGSVVLKSTLRARLRSRGGTGEDWGKVGIQRQNVGGGERAWRRGRAVGKRGGGTGQGRRMKDRAPPVVHAHAQGRSTTAARREGARHAQATRTRTKAKKAGCRGQTRGKPFPPHKGQSPLLTPPNVHDSAHTTL